ncbi:MAG: CRISPR-associated helicase/endonuclease Cas3 [Gammaproteobacteria bacterium]|nr:MAG: CRISPR-associated helicase/endonuclease Cas3 [Pseudomonadota bacterium]PIE38887.1 MAG: CRISPR-associated helicase/endonuclease Cas3 [Gammaproteobacteria bacterium]
MTEVPDYFKYWGKARKHPQATGDEYHLLPYHCLDVAAVAECWWQQSRAIPQHFVGQTGLNEEKAKAWVLFFIALHDYGKWDLRFQRKAPDTFRAVNPDIGLADFPLSVRNIKDYYHGPQGLNWFYEDFKSRFSNGDDWMVDQPEDWELWRPWLAAVAGHHGDIPCCEDAGLPSLCKDAEPLFHNARIDWVNTLEQLFLTPADLSLKENPPVMDDKSIFFLAGFCSVCDWLGSSDFFDYDAEPQISVEALRRWYLGRFKKAERALQSAGMKSHIHREPAIEKLLGVHAKPRQIQVLVDDLPLEQGLTLIEASTGSGKTEAALAYAWRLMDAGLADSIVFALPTQATANAMYDRLERAARHIFSNQTNLILAHGRARYHEGFIDLKKSSTPKTVQGQEEAWVQCSEWLAQSRKRVFLGQIGVCTVDQVLVSVLPVRHKFVRGFGIGRSVLIIDEVHAYDSYMYGLLGGVLEQQKACSGSVILLSATLPARQKEVLARSWKAEQHSENEDYPLITSYTSAESKTFDLQIQPEQRPKSTTVDIELLACKSLLPDNDLLSGITQAVIQGAQVCLICNLVDVAQNVYRKLREQFEQSGELEDSQIDLFHSRFRFCDRQSKEQKVINLFGDKPHPSDARDKGHLLIATQVVEQSLDLDFDWLISQLCPVDLLFQRMGRLHRHERDRPAGFERKVCTVLVPETPDYGLHELIYGNSRVLWRTHELLKKAIQSGVGIEFPSAYRNWIEKVYREEEWETEPKAVQESYAKYCNNAQGSYYTAKQLMNPSMNSLPDDDARISVLTRDGEMSLSVLPFYINDNGNRCLLDGQSLPSVDDLIWWEVININMVPVPHGWGKHGKGLPEPDQDGLIWLEMRKENTCFQCHWQQWVYSYTSDTGFQRNEH